MGRKIPIFPLDMVLFPNQRIPLRIFEPRYRQMLDACMSADRVFGICKVKHDVQNNGWDAPAKIGTIASIIKCEDLDLTGTNYYIEVMGKERFQINELISPALERCEPRKREPSAINVKHTQSAHTVLSLLTSI